MAHRNRWFTYYINVMIFHSYVSLPEGKSCPSILGMPNKLASLLEILRDCPIILVKYSWENSKRKSPNKHYIPIHHESLGWYIYMYDIYIYTHTIHICVVPWPSTGPGRTWLSTGSRLFRPVRLGKKMLGRPSVQVMKRGLYPGAPNTFWEGVTRPQKTPANTASEGV